MKLSIIELETLIRITVLRLEEPMFQSEKDILISLLDTLNSILNKIK